MAALLALSAAVAYGVGDFLGGVAARRVPPTAVVLWSHLVGLVMLVALAPVVGGDISPRALAVGATAGVLGGGGVALFYRGLAVGAMSVVAPVAALLSAAVPVVAGLASGERPTTAALAGIALALGAVVLISREPSSAGAPALRWQALALAVAAGLAFGLFFVAIDSAGDGVGIWPLVAARTASVSLFAGLGAARVTASGLPRGAAGAAVGLRRPRRLGQRLLRPRPRPRPAVGRVRPHRPLPGRHGPPGPLRAGRATVRRCSGRAWAWRRSPRC